MPYARRIKNGLATLAMMRKGCCPEAEPPLAVVSGLWCGILRDKLRAFGPIPERETVSDFEDIMSCLADRGMHVPARWSKVTPEQSRAAFREIIQIARRRGAI